MYYLYLVDVNCEKILYMTSDKISCIKLKDLISNLPQSLQEYISLNESMNLDISTIDEGSYEKILDLKKNNDYLDD